MKDLKDIHIQLTVEEFDTTLLALSMLNEMLKNSKYTSHVPFTPEVRQVEKEMKVTVKDLLKKFEQATGEKYELDKISKKDMDDFMTKES